MITMRKPIRLTTLLTVMTLSAGLEAMLGVERSALAQGTCEEGRLNGNASSYYLYNKRADAANAAKDSASAACTAYCAPLDSCTENKPNCKGTAKTGRMTCNQSCIFNVCGWTCSAPYTCTCSCSRDSGNGTTAGINESVEKPVSNEAFADFDGVGEAASAENPFEGSWSGIYEVAQFDVVGIVDFDVSKTGVLHGNAFNEEGGYGRRLVGKVHADGSINGAAVPLAPGTVGESYSGECSLDEGGHMVCDLIGCIRSECFGLLVTVAPVVDRFDLSAGARQGDTAGLLACESGSYERGIVWGGFGRRTSAAAKQSAVEAASAECSAQCGSLDGCTAESKPHCKGTGSTNQVTCQKQEVWGEPDYLWCSGVYTCTCSCSRNP